MKLKEWYKNKYQLGSYLMVFQVVFIMIAFFVETALGMPHAVIYVTDLITLVLFLLSLEDLVKKKEKYCRSVVIFIGLFALYTLIDFLLNSQSVLYYLWGLRNVFRFYIFFVSCMYLTKFELIPKTTKVFVIFLYVNVLVCSWQFYLLKLPADNICGLFGVVTKGSGYMNVLLVLVTVMATVHYLNQRVAMWSFMIQISCCVYISIISELKAYYIELALIVFLTLTLVAISKKKVSKRMVKAGILCVASMAFIAIATVKLNPEYWEGFFTPMGIWEEATRDSGYSASGDLNRLTAIPYLFEHIFHGSGKALFGYGLGNCDYSSGYAFLNSPFYMQYEYLHYMWMLSAFLFLEVGLIGIVLYIGFFCFVAGVAYQNTKRYKLSEEEKFWNQVSAVVALCCVFFMMYNNCLRTEAAYLIYFVLALPFVIALRNGEGDKV